jgi:hypothetical protein
VSGSVYFIRASETGPIKIGFTSGNPHDRSASLQTGNHEKLVIVAVIFDVLPSRERELHERFSKYRRHGEWFDPGPELVAFIDGVMAGDPKCRQNFWPDNHYEISHDEMEEILAEVVSRREYKIASEELTSDLSEGNDPTDSIEEGLQDSLDKYSLELEQQDVDHRKAN